MNGRRDRRPVAFSYDAIPDRPRILFIGLSSSTHTHSWIDLLEGSGFDVRLFGLPEGCPPNDWKVKTYLTTPHLPEGLDPETRLTLYPTPEEVRARRRGLRNFVQRAARKGALVTERLVGGLSPVHAGLAPLRANSAEEWLAELVSEWKPDVIHTLGLDPAGFFYHRICEEFTLRGKGRWILQLRGGSDLTLTRLDPEAVARIAPVLRACDQLVSDNLVNLEYARRMGVREDQFAPIVPVPGTGGIDVETLAQAWRAPPSERRLVLWPKAYDSPWSLALPVFEAIKLAWNQIQPCEIWMLAMNEEARMWYWSLPEEIRAHCHISERLPRDQVLKLMAAARVMLAPSLVDGTPNTMFEAMASGALPILSPLDTIVPLVRSEANVLFARNLYPQEIAEALIRSMADDCLVDSAAARNSTLVRKLADRAAIRPRIVEFYSEMARQQTTRRAAT
jgi:glycosyltransferase involved in cell wall biosynthesis